MSDILEYSIYDKVMLITINDPSSFNSLNMASMENLIKKLHAVENDPNIGAIVITGNGKAFCAGADLRQFANMPQEEIVKFCGDYGHRLFNYIATMGKPVIAAINGYALGGGFELALACDFRIGSSKATFALPEFQFGWLPGWGGIPRLAALIGTAKAKEIAFTKERILSDKALQLGILSKVVPDEELIKNACEMGNIMATLNPLTVSTTKMLCNQMEVSQLNSYFQAFVCSLTSKMPYCRQTIQDFFDKRSKK